MSGRKRSAKYRLLKELKGSLAAKQSSQARDEEAAANVYKEQFASAQPVSPDVTVSADVDRASNDPDSDVNSSCDSNFSWGNESESEVSFSVSLPSSRDTFGSTAEDSIDEFDTPCEIIENGLRELVNKYPTVPHAFVEDLLSLLKNIDVLNGLPCRSVTLLKTDTTKVVDKMNDANDIEGEFFYSGIIRGVEDQVRKSPEVLRELQQSHALNLSFSTDGASLFKSAVNVKTAWPILCRVHLPNLFVEPLVVAMFFGQSKPDHERFFREFTNELSSISEKTVMLCGLELKVKILFGTADAPARNFIKCTKSYNSKKGCEHCSAVAKKIDHRMCYPSTPGQPRTHQNFVQRNDPDHHKGTSLFENVPHFDMVHQIPIEPMHGVDEGIMKRELFHLCLETKGKARLAPSVTEKISKRILALAKYVPKDFPRTLVPLKFLNVWKATMFRLLNTYLIPVIFYKIVPEEIYKHLIKLHVALRILRNPNLVKKQEPLQQARELLQDFVTEYAHIYGCNQLVFNVHNALHLADCVEHLQMTLDEFSSYSTEDKLRALVRKVKPGDNVAAQVARRISEETSVAVKCLFRDEPKIMYDKKGSVKQVMYKKFNFCVGSRADSFVLVKGGAIMKVMRVTVKDEDISLKCRVIKSMGDIFTDPLSSAALGEQWVKPTYSTVTINLEDVRGKAMIVPLEGRYAAFPLLHTL
jgi:hypothetical protein